MLVECGPPGEGMAWMWALQGRVLQMGDECCLSGSDKGFSQERPGAHNNSIVLHSYLSLAPLLSLVWNFQALVSTKCSCLCVCVCVYVHARWWWLEATSPVRHSECKMLSSQEMLLLLLQITVQILNPGPADNWHCAAVTPDQASSRGAFPLIHVAAEMSSTRRCLKNLLLKEFNSGKGTELPIRMLRWEVKATETQPRTCR